MESALPIIFLVGLVILAARIANAKGRGDASKPNPIQHKPKANPERFDAPTSVTQPTPQVLQGTAYITDGDTLTIKKTQVRLFGIDAPELNHPYGQKAKWALVKLCKGQSIRAEITEKDAYDRTVARCYLPDGRDLSAEMVKLGLAIDWPKFSGGKYSSLEQSDSRKKMWLADARQKGRMHVWAQFDAKQKSAKSRAAS